MRNLLLLLTLLVSANTLGGDLKYMVSSIPDALRKDANAVIREKNVYFKILSKNAASLEVHKVITILNGNGSDFATEVVGYDKMSKVTNISGNIYDASGALVKKIKNSEIIDQSAYDGFTLYSDNRIKVIQLNYSTYPYTVEFEYTLDLKFLFFIPAYSILPDEHVSLEHGSFSIEFPSDLAPRYKTINTSAEPLRKFRDGSETLSWTFENTPAIVFEPLSLSSHVIPEIIAAPGKFKYDDYEGTMNSWKDFGKWIGTLNAGRNIVPEQTKQQLKKLTADLPTREEKVRAVYEYMQNKTRYVGIQLGIGGLQPFEASVVDQTGYGDCKALSNYMVSMLQTLDIPANYVLINSDRTPEPLHADFPSSQFNHVVVAVPNDQDTLWLECTSQTAPFGFMGKSTADRKALMITGQGAEIVNTLRYTADQNKQSRIADVYVDASGNAKAKVITTYEGIQYENDYLNFILSDQYDEQKKWLHKTISIPSFDITGFSFKNRKDKIPAAVVTVEMNLNKYAIVNGKRIFITPNLMNRSSYVPEKVEQRKSPVTVRSAYTDLDTIRYHLPEGIYPEFLPQPVKIASRFGEYESSFKLDQGSMIYIRRVKMNKGEFAPESYNEMIEFYKAINKADNMKLVFMNKT